MPSHSPRKLRAWHGSWTRSSFPTRRLTNTIKGGELDVDRATIDVHFRSPEIGFSPIWLRPPFLRNGNASPQSGDLLTTTWVGTSIRMVLVQTPARFLRSTLRQRETRSVDRQKTRAPQGLSGRTARRIRRYRHCVPAVLSR